MVWVIMELRFLCLVTYGEKKSGRSKEMIRRKQIKRKIRKHKE